MLREKMESVEGDQLTALLSLPTGIGFMIITGGLVGGGAEYLSDALYIIIIILSGATGIYFTSVGVRAYNRWVRKKAS